MVTTMPRVHVAITGIEKVVPNLEDVATLMRLLPRHATGQSISNYVSFTTGKRAPGDVDGPEHFHIILATTEPFDHCCFTVRADCPPEREQQFLQVLFSMRYDNPKHREMMDLEGLKAWVPGRTLGYGLLHEAVERQQFFAGTQT